MRDRKVTTQLVLGVGLPESGAFLTRVLHITPHLGGGVGKALSGLVEQARRLDTGFEHEILCLEIPEKPQFADRVRLAGCGLRLCPSPSDFAEAIRDADIVQLEFWNHPATARALCSAPLPAMRLLAWCHVSGLHNPRIPPGLLSVAHKFLFTSDCSLEAEEVGQLMPRVAANLGVVSSGGGLDLLPLPRTTAREGGLQVGYTGSLNFAKLHPDFVSFLAAARTLWHPVRLIGDETNRAVLEEQCRRLGRPDMLEFRGYTTDMAAELAELDILVYLLNPKHYGTAENALLEAMAMGVIPVVLDNPAERRIVEDRRTGLVVRTPGELADALDWLTVHREERLEMGRRAAASVRERFTYERMENAFNAHYDGLMRRPKAFIPFGSVFGDGPADWFRAFYRDASAFSDRGDVHLPANQPCHALFERTKGSVFHFLDYFPDDTRLQCWATSLQRSLSRSTAAS